ncbi:hypothetical protein PLESTB_000428700 [Pleodorina starrii]|uniref:glycerophosphodiester phosphodiesterase n=1 Tax=Pleodorina starrii TaxID=330485 RepID=A0A9W6EZM4_9CHLO|nr:hypothetical protein PLESTM_001695200 [Pleodorina starrii]GLC50759.1 hypothetical protein PLESTB_000428700 [Pleodorina starrii]GLC74333.1 hypothetical protein PLESTF_001500700 [Pleodorina starrii]
MQAQRLRLQQSHCFWLKALQIAKASLRRPKVNSAAPTACSASFCRGSFSARPALIMGKSGPMLLGGHRGMGENLATTSPDGKTGVYPAFRENTIESFQQAVKCGVGFVEFDVQVTRDNVPVIWHDDDVVFGPADHPSKPQVKDLTLAELKKLCGKNRHSGSGSGGPAAAAAPSAAAAASSGESCGAASDSDCDGAAAAAAGASPSVSSDGGAGGSEGDAGGQQQSRGLLRLFRDRNTRQRATRYEQWQCEQDDSIPTLEAVFSALPPEVGFDIEIKMTTGDDVVHTPSEEVERMLNAILPVVHRCASSTSSSTSAAAAAAAPSGASPPPSPLPTAHLTDPQPQPQQEPQPHPQRRRIMFSSFDPDVCVELRRRQSAHPVYYLSGCGLYSHADARRTSIPAALSFAAEAGMRGIVLPASVLLKNMDMVESASRSRLELMTYGLENNDLDSLKAQADAGVVAAIVDEVAGVTAALQAGEAAAAEE